MQYFSFKKKTNEKKNNNTFLSDYIQINFSPKLKTIYGLNSRNWHGHDMAFVNSKHKYDQEQDERQE